MAKLKQVFEEVFNLRPIKTAIDTIKAQMDIINTNMGALEAQQKQEIKQKTQEEESITKEREQHQELLKKQAAQGSATSTEKKISPPYKKID